MGRPCYHGAMRDRTSKHPKRPRDINQLAYQIVQEATGQAPPKPEEPEDPIRSAAATLGRLGGLKGGKARTASMTPEQRRESARKAAAARWKHHP
jgi:hypothetical protein